MKHFGNVHVSYNLPRRGAFIDALSKRKHCARRAIMVSAPVRVIVTGGTGFIGYALLSTLRESHLSDFTPVAVARPSSDRVRLERLLDYPSVAESVVTAADLTNSDSLAPALHDAGVVVHLAANVDFFPRDKGASIDENLKMTRALVRACKTESERTGRRVRLLYVSSTEAIGSTGESPAREDTPRNPDSAYGRSKGECEDIVRAASDALDVVVLRPTGVYGRGERFFFRELLEMAESGLSVVFPSPGTGQVMFTHVDDVVSAIILCMREQAAIGETYNVCPDSGASYLDIMRALNAAFQRPGPVATLRVPLGKLLVRAISPLMNFRKKRVFLYHPSTIERSLLYRVYSNEKIKQELGWKPVHEVLPGMNRVALEEIATNGIQRRKLSPLLCGMATFTCSVFLLVWRSR